MTTRAGSGPSPCTLALAVLAGAALGAVVMALATPRTGREVRATLRRALRPKALDPAEATQWDPEDLETLFI